MTRPTWRAAVPFALIALLLRAGDALAQGCAMCGTAFVKDDPLTRAFTWSVIFLMATPYTIFGVLGGWFYLHYRRAAAAQHATVIDLAPTSAPRLGVTPGGEPEGELS